MIGVIMRRLVCGVWNSVLRCIAVPGAALLIGIGTGVAAALRLMLSDERAGVLVLRDRGLDFATMTTAATVMVYIAATIDPLGTG